MYSAPPIDLSAIPADQRAAVAALLWDYLALKGETADQRNLIKRMEHIVAELNQAVHSNDQRS